MGSIASCGSSRKNVNNGISPVIDTEFPEVKNQAITSKDPREEDGDNQLQATDINTSITLDSFEDTSTAYKQSNEVDYDIYISYSPDDTEIVTSITAYLRNHGLKFWHLRYGSEKLKDNTDKGKAIVNAKVIIVVLSISYIKNKAKVDEVSLAYISNKPIVPLSLRYFREINQEMGFALKLTLSKLNWVFFCKKERYDKEYATVLEGVKREIRKISSHDEILENRRASFIEDDQFNFQEETASTVQHSSMSSAKSSLVTAVNFWDRHFQAQETTWVEFRKAFVSDYHDVLKRDYPDDRQEWLLQGVIWKDIFTKKDVIRKEEFTAFCGKNWSKPHKFLSCVSNQVASRLAIHEVFNMESTVRMAAVENLGKYQTPIVISALADLLDDTDPNIRAIASIALARTGVKSKKHIDKLILLLQDEDRLVRESACLSLGHMKAESSIINILNRWRNDPISHVREAALIALEEIGGEEANEAIRVTKLLGNEMNELNSYLLSENVL
ncbi:hypothetical protein TrispH2_006850 [Trichoplax sp. H2]|nr:hypothetical protein TrispH2_006850 [Trichoplax sp. H2]|eukprot:RDD40004.1 hypothetical protein TrispH2_006850 [Trichoplax sp. H2]